MKSRQPIFTKSTSLLIAASLSVGAAALFLPMMN